MNIIVFVKQVADTEARILIKSDQKALEIENKYNLNFFDEFAVEEAIRIKEKLKDGQVTVCTYGPKRALEALRTAIAMGADRAVLLDNTGLEADDPLIVARILAAFASQDGFDLILCGRQAIDDENANVGPMAAEFLGIPHVSAVVNLEVVDGQGVKVESEVEGGKQIIEVTLPALLSAQKGLNTPRVPLITGVMKAMKAAIPTVDPTSLGIPKEEIGPDASKVVTLSYEPPQQRPPVKIIEGQTPAEKVRNLIKVLKEESKVL
ncbi:MAG: Electron transfer flavoprotein subunit beta [Syntrophorhabdus sp. PtaU1.Bin153]|nr:MAG: Electron transfer flavoprotein subunit beta [Syntrophorhabdus sp. PtaU1.Bin153]